MVSKLMCSETGTKNFHANIQQAIPIAFSCLNRDEIFMLLSISIPSIGRKSLQITINSIVQQESNSSDNEIIIVAQEFDTENIPVEIPNLKIGQEDDLFCRLSSHHDFINLDKPVTCVLRGEGWETSTDNSIKVDNLRKLRNKILDQSNTFKRLKDCDLDPFWKGRVLRIFLSSDLMKLRKKTFMEGFFP